MTTRKKQDNLAVALEALRSLAEGECSGEYGVPAQVRFAAALKLYEVGTQPEVPLDVVFGEGR